MCWQMLGASFLYIYIRYLQAHQKMVTNPITDGCEPPCGCWELNSGSLEEQSVLLTAEPSLQPQKSFFWSLISGSIFVVCY